jgi:choline dehydrogenase-like flavoprotein
MSVVTGRRGRAAEWDVVVVGAGPTGILATEHLRTAGLRVLLLEAGRRQQRGGALTPADHPQWRFQSVGGSCQWLRAHGVGGGSLIWGGWTNRFSEVVFCERNWPYHIATLAPAYAEAERWLGVVEGVLDPRYRRAAAALGLPFRPRRGTKLGHTTWTARSRPAARSARTETVALTLDLEGERARAIEVLGPNGRSEAISARAFVIAASPIETCRLLLASGVRHPALGHGLVDHMSVSYLLIESGAEVPKGERGPFPGAAFIPRFVNLTGTDQAKYQGGFSIEIVGPWPLHAAGANLLRSMDVSVRRGMHHTFITALGEISHHPERYVDLAPRARDAFGRRLPRLHLAWSDEERLMAADMAETCVAVAEAIATPGAELICYHDPFSAPTVFHPAGTCAMGKSDAFPCDPHGRLRTLPNVFIADASVFPSAGDCHPTLTTLAHTCHMTKEVQRWLR